MRLLSSDEHQTRKEKILQAVIHIYIRTGKPVGSSTILNNFQFNLSPASVRNVLAELEKEGYLTHPHTSAGRVPTDAGYRFYVDQIAKIQQLAQEEEQRIQQQYAKRMQEIEDFMRSTTRILSRLSNCTGFALKPQLTEERLRRIELVPLNPNQFMGVLVSESGMVKNQMISVDKVPDEQTLRNATRLLNEQLKGCSFSQAQDRFLSELQRIQVQHLAQREFFEDLSHQLFEVTDNANLLVDGTRNLLNFPEFNDLEGLRNFASLVDEKDMLAQVVNKELNQKGLQVRIGEETSPELKDFSVVSSSYHVRGRPMGVLGILGPKRMEYERMMAIVNTVAHIVDQFLEKNRENFLEEK